jgi:hypothetical protein
MTAVEYLYQVMFDKQGRISLEEFQQAKEMEKQQIVDAYKEAEDMHEFFQYEHMYGRKYLKAEQYYNETFNKNESN